MICFKQIIWLKIHKYWIVVLYSVFPYVLLWFTVSEDSSQFYQQLQWRNTHFMKQQQIRQRKTRKKTFKQLLVKNYQWCIYITSYKAFWHIILRIVQHTLICLLSWSIIIHERSYIMMSFNFTFHTFFSC